jgi:hypothetical protein
LCPASSHARLDLPGVAQLAKPGHEARVRGLDRLRLGLLLRLARDVARILGPLLLLERPEPERPRARGHDERRERHEREEPPLPPHPLQVLFRRLALARERRFLLLPPPLLGLGLLPRVPLLKDAPREPVVPDLEVAAPLVRRGVQDGRALERAQNRAEPLTREQPQELCLRAQRPAAVARDQVLLEQPPRVGAQLPEPVDRGVQVEPQDRLGVELFLPLSVRLRPEEHGQHERLRHLLVELRLLPFVLLEQRPAHDLRVGGLHLGAVAIGLPGRPHVAHQLEHLRQIPGLRRLPRGRRLAHRARHLRDRHRPQAKAVREQGPVVAGAIAEPPEVIFPQREHDLEARDRRAREGGEGDDEDLDVGLGAVREEELLDLIQVNQDGLVAPALGERHRLLDGLRPGDGLFRLAEFQLRVERADEPRERRLPEWPAVHAHDAEIMGLDEPRDDARLHDRALPGARGPVQRRDHAREHLRGDLLREGLAPEEPLAVGGAIRLRARERVTPLEGLAHDGSASDARLDPSASVATSSTSTPSAFPGNPEPFSQSARSCSSGSSTARLPRGMPRWNMRWRSIRWWMVCSDRSTSSAGR